MKKFIYLLIGILIISSSIVFAKNNLAVPTIKPKIGYIPDLSIQAQKEWAEGEKIYNRIVGGEKETNLTVDERRKLKKFDDSKKDIWDIRGEGDDWYNSGGPYKVSATTELKSSGQVKYVAQNAHDSSYKTVWVEGKPDYGIGESLLYYFKANSPRVNKIIIFNGYLKSKDLWRDNSRVKKFKVYTNNNLIAVLELKDTMAQQEFEITPVSSKVKNKDLILRFEIVEVYPGSKFKDTAITELYFSGLDVL